MKPAQTYLKGRSVFTVSLIVIVVTSLTVYITGIDYNRSLTTNLYISLGIIAAALFLFMTYSLYKGVGLIDNYPKFKDIEGIDFVASSGPGTDIPVLDVGEGIGGLLVSILLWIVMSILFVILLALLEAIFWISLFIILGMLYWIFFRALKFVFSKGENTKGDIAGSAIYGFVYTLLYTGWVFAIVYLSEVIN